MVHAKVGFVSEAQGSLERVGLLELLLGDGHGVRRQRLLQRFYAVLWN